MKLPEFRLSDYLDIYGRNYIPGYSVVVKLICLRIIFSPHKGIPRLSLYAVNPSTGRSIQFRMVMASLKRRGTRLLCFVVGHRMSKFICERCLTMDGEKFASAVGMSRVR